MSDRTTLQIAITHLVERASISKAVESIVKTSYKEGAHSRGSEIHALVFSMAGLPETCPNWKRTQYVVECFLEYGINISILHGVEVYRNVDIGFPVSKTKRRKIGYKSHG